MKPLEIFVFAALLLVLVGLSAAKVMADKSISLIKLVEEKAAAKKLHEENKQKLRASLTPYFPSDCVSNILVRLPLDSLLKLRFVCKMWYKIVNSAVFALEYFERSESCLLFRHQTRADLFLSSPEKNIALSIESKLFQLQQSRSLFQKPLINPTQLSHLKFMEIIGGQIKAGEYNATCLGNIRACFAGLILVDNELKGRGVIVLNPVTKKMSALPVGTLSSYNWESYGLGFCDSKKQFKVVRLFQQKPNCTECEILTLGEKSWRLIKGPAFGLIVWYGYNPVVAIGAMHWVPKAVGSEYIVSMTLDDEKFHETALPKPCGSVDRILEMRGQLGFVGHEELNVMDVWFLRSLSEGWEKKYIITVCSIPNLIPLCFTRISGEMIFMGRRGCLYVYDHTVQLMTKLEMPENESCIDHRCFAHVNSLFSWKASSEDVFY